MIKDESYDHGLVMRDQMFGPENRSDRTTARRAGRLIAWLAISVRNVMASA